MKRPLPLIFLLIPALLTSEPARSTPDTSEQAEIAEWGRKISGLSFEETKKLIDSHVHSNWFRKSLFVRSAQQPPNHPYSPAAILNSIAGSTATERGKEQLIYWYLYKKFVFAEIDFKKCCVTGVSSPIYMDQTLRTRATKTKYLSTGLGAFFGLTGYLFFKVVLLEEGLERNKRQLIAPTLCTTAGLLLGRGFSWLIYKSTEADVCIHLTSLIKFILEFVPAYAEHLPTDLIATTEQLKHDLEEAGYKAHASISPSNLEDVLELVKDYYLNIREKTGVT